MGNFAVIRPCDDGAARQASQWCDALINGLKIGGHCAVADVSDQTPASQANVCSALSGSYDVIFYFGHGDETAWLTQGAATVDATTISGANGKAIVSVACKTARRLGPDAITAGVASWLGFNIKVGYVVHRGQDPFGDAIVQALEGLGAGNTLQQARDTLASNLQQVVQDFDTSGRFNSWPTAPLAYFVAVAMRDHVVVLGNNSLRPL